MRSLRPLFLLLAPLVLGAAGCRPEAWVWEPFEAVLPIAVEAGNPFDPGEVAVDAEFRAPWGRIFRVPAFAYQPYARSVRADGGETLTPDGDREWRIRFTPHRAGPWRWRWLRTTAAGSEIGPWQRLPVGRKRDPDRHGFVRTSRWDTRYLRFDDGTPFVPVGENLAWYDFRGTGAYEDWFAKLAERGVNYVRLWLPSWSMGLVYAPAQLDDWSARMDRAWQLDRVLALAAQHGIYVMLSVQNHGPFELGGFFGSGWPTNLYNAANGGPLGEPHEFFENETAREIFRRYLRYVVARWGAGTHVMNYELWNEVNLAEQPATLEPVLAWHREMAGLLRDLDPHDHLISTSTTDELMVLTAWTGSVPLEEFPLAFAPLWALPEIDFVQVHGYQIASATLQLPMHDLVHQLVNRMRAFGKPVLLAEAGVDFQGPAETLRADPEGEGFHDLLWAGLFAGGFGSGMSWWWDNVVDPEDYYFHFAPLTRLVAGVPLHRERITPERRAVGGADRDVVAYLLPGRRTLLAWIKNAEHEFYAPDRGLVAGAELVLPPLAPGRWRGSFVDTWTGADLAAVDVVVRADSETTLAVPAFRRDAALRLDRAR